MGRGPAAEYRVDRLRRLWGAMRFSRLKVLLADEELEACARATRRSSCAAIRVFNPRGGGAGWAAETRRAIAKAEAALPAWRSLLAKDRARILRRWADLMLEHEEELARLLDDRAGQATRRGAGRDPYAASFYEWFGEEAKRVYGDTIPTYAPDRRIVVIKHPVGVTAGITPWNFPAAMPTRKSAPALAAGCTMVLKPAEQTPLSALAIARLGRRGGPAGGRLPDRHRRCRGRARDRRRADRQPARPQARLHRLDRGREAADGAVREAGEEGLARARRQRAVHRLRRRRPRRRGRGGADLQVPEQRPDVHLGQPDPRPGRNLRRVRLAPRRRAPRS